MTHQCDTITLSTGK